MNFILDKTLEVINGLEKDGIIGKYAIGCAIGAMFYTEGYWTNLPMLRIPRAGPDQIKRNIVAVYSA